METGTLAILMFSLLAVALLLSLLLLSASARRAEQERLRLLRQQNELLQRSVKLQEAELRLKLSQQPAKAQPAQLPEPAPEAEPEQRVIIRYGQVHTYTKPIVEPPANSERDERKEAHERKIDRMRRW